MGTTAKPIKRNPGPGDLPTRQANGTVRMTYAPASECERTTDRADRAHVHRGEDGLLVPARMVGGGKPRMYPACYMHGPPDRRVSCETVADVTQQAIDRLSDEGIAIGGGRVWMSQFDALKYMSDSEVYDLTNQTGGRYRTTKQVDWVTGREVYESEAAW